MFTSDRIDQIALALSKAQGEMSNAAFNKVNPHFKSRYADLSAVRDSVISALSKNEISLIQTTDIIDNKIILITTLCHSSGQYISSKMPVIAEKPTPQSLGSALTYARRYALSSIAGIASEEDDDGNEAEKESQKQKELEKLQKIQEEQAQKLEAKRSEILSKTIPYYGQDDFVEKFEDVEEYFNFILENSIEEFVLFEKNIKSFEIVSKFFPEFRNLSGVIATKIQEAKDE